MFVVCGDRTGILYVIALRMSITIDGVIFFVFNDLRIHFVKYFFF